MPFSLENLKKDAPASISVFLIALPLCLGIALSSQGVGPGAAVPLMAGIIAGVIGGIVVGAISGSHTSVSGPAAGLVAIVIPAMTTLQSFPLFVLALLLAGLIQVGLGVFRAGVIAYYFPTSVIKGLLAAIGLILIFKQIPHAFGHDADAPGDFSFWQPDGFNTLSELAMILPDFDWTATLMAAISLVILMFWQRSSWLKTSFIPAALVVVVVGVLINLALAWFWPNLSLGSQHLVSLVAEGSDLTLATAFTFPDWSGLLNGQVYVIAVQIAIVATLETLLNLEATDRLDKNRRVSPPNRELVAQGVGNMMCGLIGGLPVTSVVVRSSANVYADSKSKMSTILHGVWLAVFVALLPSVLMLIPLSALAAILLVTGFKLTHPAIYRDMWRQGPSQFVPFLVTVIAIFFTDLMYGIFIGLGVGVFFILRSMATTPFTITQNKPLPGNIQRLKLAQHMSFLSRASVLTRLDALEPNSHVILDATATDYIDPEILELFHDFESQKAPQRKIEVSLIGFQDSYQVADKLIYSDVVTEAWQAELTPRRTLEILKSGNLRYRSGNPIERDLAHQRHQTTASQHPLAAVLGCIDSRVPAEIVFDMGLGAMFAVRVAGNVVNNDVLASLEYAGQVSKVPLIVILGHTGCGAVRAACDGVKLGHITELLEKIDPAVVEVSRQHPHLARSETKFAEKVTLENVRQMMLEVRQKSDLLRNLENEGRLAIVGGVYDLASGAVQFLEGSLEDSPLRQV